MAHCQLNCLPLRPSYTTSSDTNPRRPHPDLALLEVDIPDHPCVRLDHRVVSRTGIGERRLQRLFTEYVGATPKWMIRRSRLHEAPERLAAAEHVDLAALALELGYFDQSHFAGGFKTIVGKPPAGYARSAARPC